MKRPEKIEKSWSIRKTIFNVINNFFLLVAGETGILYLFLQRIVSISLKDFTILVSYAISIGGKFKSFHSFRKIRSFWSEHFSDLSDNFNCLLLDVTNF